MLLGVSRQSVTKWEAEKSYPEMDKLLKMCSIFECSLDDLVTGDLTNRPAEDATAPKMPGGPATDVCGYDDHAKSLAWRIPTGIVFIMLASHGPSLRTEALRAFFTKESSLPSPACSPALWRGWPCLFPPGCVTALS